MRGIAGSPLVCFSVLGFSWFYLGGTGFSGLCLGDSVFGWFDLGLDGLYWNYLGVTWVVPFLSWASSPTMFLFLSAMAVVLSLSVAEVFLVSSLGVSGLAWSLGIGEFLCAYFWTVGGFSWVYEGFVRCSLVYFGVVGLSSIFFGLACLSRSLGVESIYSLNSFLSYILLSLLTASLRISLYFYLLIGGFSWEILEFAYFSPLDVWLVVMPSYSAISLSIFFFVSERFFSSSFFLAAFS